MFADAMMKHLHYIFLFMCPRIRNVRHSARGTAGTSDAYRSLGRCFCHSCHGCSSQCQPITSRPLPTAPSSTIENNERKIKWCPFQENFYNQASAPSKLLKLKIHPSVEQMQRIFSTHLPVEQNASLSFTPSAIRYSYGYYVYELKHILI